MILVGAILLILLVAIGIDTFRTGYLKVKNIEFSDNDSYLITNVNIIPMNQDTVLIDKMVHVKDGVIQKIGDQIELEGVEIIDAGNRFLTPGLIDMHVHIWDR